MKKTLFIIFLVLAITTCGCRTVEEKHWQDNMPENLTPDDIKTEGVILFKW